MSNKTVWLNYRGEHITKPRVFSPEIYRFDGFKKSWVKENAQLAFGDQRNIFKIFLVVVRNCATRAAEIAIFTKQATSIKNP